MIKLKKLLKNPTKQIDLNFTVKDDNAIDKVYVDGEKIIVSKNSGELNIEQNVFLLNNQIHIIWFITW